MNRISVDNVDTSEYIVIKGARVNNLKNINVIIPRNKFVVITGLSGSGKSSLAFDTLYAEGQRRYVESLSSYARQFLGRMNKPEVDYIKGISPAIAIEQKVNTRNPRSTVGTSTEIYEYLKLLFARIGKTYSPVSGSLVSRHSVADVVDYVCSLPEETKVLLYSPVRRLKDRSLDEQLNIMLQQGFSRIMKDGEIVEIQSIVHPDKSGLHFVQQNGVQSTEKSEERRVKSEEGKKTTAHDPKSAEKIIQSTVHSPQSTVASKQSTVGRKKHTPNPSQEGNKVKTEDGVINVIIDRMVVRQDDEEFRNRLSDSVQTAFYEGDGECVVMRSTVHSPQSTEKGEERRVKSEEGKSTIDHSQQSAVSSQQLAENEFTQTCLPDRQGRKDAKDNEDGRGKSEEGKSTIDHSQQSAVSSRQSVENEFTQGRKDAKNNEEGRGKSEYGGWHIRMFSNRFEADGISFEEPTPNLFSFNNPYGACKTCGGFGNIIGIDEDLVIPDKSLSVYDGAVVCWHGEKMKEWKEDFVMTSYKYGFPVHKPYIDLNAKQKELLWKGKQGEVFGLNDFFKMVEENLYKIQYRVMLSRYRGKTVCPECNGSRLRKEAIYVKVSGKTISELVLMPADELMDFFKNIILTGFEKKVSDRILLEINNRLKYLVNVGLGYLTLNRLSSTLSGGESQRINLATSLGNNLVGSIYILDEQSIGLHPRDTHRLIEVLKELRDLGNTVIVVEHDEEIMRASDYIIDLGPEAGVNGGEVVFMGNFNNLIKEGQGLTAKYLKKEKEIAVPEVRRKWKEYIEVKGARENNLKNIDVKFPLNALTVITGVSGSGKTTLVKQTLYTSLRKMFDIYDEKAGVFSKLDGDIKKIGNIEFVDQNPIGRSSRSNPATYIKAYDDIRQIFAEQQLSKVRGYKPGFFSFNIPGGRCEECEGDGVVKISMQFMADVYLVCESCGGRRFKDEVLDVTYRGKNISEILNLTIDDAIKFFSEISNSNSAEKRIISKLMPLQDVGLGYLQLGQSSSTLSGGEAQRVKLAYFLVKGTSEKPTLFIFDEPTTGLHFHDIKKLYSSFKALIENGHSIIVIEHNMEIIKCSDWVIDLGPEGGKDGGNIVFEGTPEQLIHSHKSYTAKYLKKALEA